MHREALTKEGRQLLPALRASDDFYLAGGTALALQIGHRISVDFDLFSPLAIRRSLFAKAKETFAPEALTPLVNDRGQLTILVRDVKVTFLTYPFPLIERLVRMNGLSMLSVKEIAATKAYTIGRRGTYKDYVDLYFIVAEGCATLEEIIAMAEQKFGAEFQFALICGAAAFHG
jgi:Nucleotidyl transferase AbiEii toxin, Type IV TA system